MREELKSIIKEALIEAINETGIGGTKIQEPVKLTPTVMQVNYEGDMPTPQQQPAPTVPGPAQPAQPAPTVPGPAQPAAELDTDGIPWDERIHASSKAKVADGTWRKKRGLDGLTYDKIKAELKAQYANASVSPGQPPVPVDNIPSTVPELMNAANQVAGFAFPNLITYVQGMTGSNGEKYKNVADMTGDTENIRSVAQAFGLTNAA